MGGHNTKQTQEQSSVQIDHPKFSNAMILQQKGNISMITTMGLEEKEYNKWKQQISILKLDPEYLLMPKSHQFSSKGFCGSTGTLTVAYDYFPYLLKEEIQSRLKRKSKFQQCELWFLLFSLSAAQIEMKKLFDSKIGDIRPQNVFINQEGQIKLACINSWPRQTTAFEKTFERQLTLLSPEDMSKLELSGTNDPKNYQSQMFSIGMTILSAAFLTDFSDIYDLKNMKFRYQQALEYLNQWRSNTLYSEIFTAFISNLCSFQPEKRLTQKELWSWINKYEEEIKNKEDFFIDHAPLKIDKQIQQLRNQTSNISVMHDQSHMSQILPQNSHQPIPFQDNSIVYPFMQGLTDQRVMSQGQQVASSYKGGITSLNSTNLTKPLQPSTVISSRDSLSHQKVQKNYLESINHNIMTAESMYTPIPPELLQKKLNSKYEQGQFATTTNAYLPSQLAMQNQLAPLKGQLSMQGQLPPGVIPGRGLQTQGLEQKSGIQGTQQRVTSPTIQQQFYPSGMNQMPPANGNFVYTRRIIDPTTGTVVGEQRIGQDQYQRGVASIDQPQEGDY